MKRTDAEALVESLGIEPREVSHVRLMPAQIEVVCVVRVGNRLVPSPDRQGVETYVRTFPYEAADE